MLSVGQRYVVKIEESNIFANGVCHIEDMVVFVKNAIMGENCEIEISKVFPKYAYATCVNLMEASEHRIKPSCPCVENCGGCSFLHVSQELENEIKCNYVKSAFKKQHLNVEIENIYCPVSSM